jgi:adenosylhomocysteine nucleosidase
MSDILFDDPCVVFALGRESAPFLREFPPQERFPGSPCWAKFCGPEWLSLLVLETGVGHDRAEQAMRWLFSTPKFGDVPARPRLVLSAGFAGALQDGFQIGDIVLATDVTDSTGTVWPANWPGDLPPGEWRPPLIRGRVLSTDRLIGDPIEKRRLGGDHQAAVVDMESAVIARWCHKHNVPFGCVRAVSDDVNTSLSPRLLGLLSKGRASWLRLAVAALTSPRLLGEMRRLARHTHKAAEQLGKALGEVLTLSLPWANQQ